MAIEKIETSCEVCGGPHTITKYRGHLAKIKMDKGGLITLSHSMYQSFQEQEVAGSKLEAVQVLYVRLARQRNNLLKELCQFDRSLELVQAEIDALTNVSRADPT